MSNRWLSNKLNLRTRQQLDKMVWFQSIDKQSSSLCITSWSAKMHSSLCSSQSDTSFVQFSFLISFVRGGQYILIYSPFSSSKLSSFGGYTLFGYIVSPVILTISQYCNRALSFSYLSVYQLECGGISYFIPQIISHDIF